VLLSIGVPEKRIRRVREEAWRIVSFGDCGEVCMQNCYCLAYASVDVQDEGGCITWHGDSIDTRMFKDEGQNLYVCVDALELGTDHQ